MAKLAVDPRVTLEGLEDWLKTQKPETKYNYRDPYDCLVARFIATLGYLRPHVIPGSWRADDSGLAFNLPDSMDEVSIGMPRTYKGALGRIADMRKTSRKKKEI